MKPWTVISKITVLTQFSRSWLYPYIITISVIKISIKKENKTRRTHKIVEKNIFHVNRKLISVRVVYGVYFIHIIQATSDEKFITNKNQSFSITIDLFITLRGSIFFRSSLKLFLKKNDYTTLHIDVMSSYHQTKKFFLSFIYSSYFSFLFIRKWTLI